MAVRVEPKSFALALELALLPFFCHHLPVFLAQGQGCPRALSCLETFATWLLPLPGEETLCH